MNSAGGKTHHNVSCKTEERERFYESLRGIINVDKLHLGDVTSMKSIYVYAERTSIDSKNN